MKAKEIQDLIDFISSSDLDEVNIETNDFKISVKKNAVVAAAPVAPAPVAVAPAPVAVSAPAAPATPAAAAPATEAAPAAASNSQSINSPMIGTFYRSSKPDVPPFVEVGDKVSKGQTVCIVEAMKLFNEIESEVDGIVVKVLVDDSTPVEYDQPLFLVEPA